MSRLDEDSKVTFQGTSQGQLAMVMYEWSDASYLGKYPSDALDERVSFLVCTQASTESRLGRRRSTSVPQMHLWAGYVTVRSSEDSS